MGNPKRLPTETFVVWIDKLETYLALQGLDFASATPEQVNADNRPTWNKKSHDAGCTNTSIGLAIDCGNCWNKTMQACVTAGARTPFLFSRSPW